MSARPDLAAMSTRRNTAIPRPAAQLTMNLYGDFTCTICHTAQPKPAFTVWDEDGRPVEMICTPCFQQGADLEGKYWTRL